MGGALRCTTQVSAPLKGEVDEEEEKWRMAKGVGKNESVAATFLLLSVRVKSPSVFLSAGQRSCCGRHRSPWLVCVRNAAAGLYMSSGKHCLSFCPVVINEAFVWTCFLCL